MNMNRIYSIIASLFTVWAFSACTVDDVGRFEFSEFGISQSEVIFPARAEYNDGKVVTDLKKDIQILSNQDCFVTYCDGEVDWMRIRNLEDYQVCRQIAFTGDCTFRIECDQNDDYARMVKLLVRTSSRTDTLVVRQSGKREPSLRLASSSLILDGSKGGSQSVEYSTNITDLESLECVISYPSDQEWITSATVGDGSLTISYDANADKENLRTASVKISYTDGFGTEYSQTLYVIQKTGNDGLGKSMSFSEIRSLGRAGETVTIDDYVMLEGYVVGNKESGNSGENEKLSTTSSDNTSYLKDIYVESLDAAYGFLIKAATVEDNIFSRYDKVTLLLKGMTIRKELEPERYVIEGFTTANVVGREAGTSAPEKEKYISELTDNDLYTQVTLKDCEFAVRKGSLTPVNDAYTLSSGKGFISKYPRLVRDIQGSTIYTYTNTTCPYRRDGVKLPYGSGTLTGVVVSELYPNYVYGDNDDDDLCGNIGRYQIRHQAYSDIAFDKERTFSNILLEFRYAAGFRSEDGVSYFRPTEGQATARFLHSTGAAVTYCPSTFNYIGWTGTSAGVAPFKNHKGVDASLDEPLGYSFATGYYFDYSGTNSDGKGKVDSRSKNNSYNGASAKIYDGWMSKAWWNDATDKAESWIIEFSTKDVTASHVSMQFTSYGAQTGATGKTPYSWTAYWSETGDLSDDAAWHKIADYVVPDGVVNGQERDWQLPAFKQYDFALPLEILGKEKVFIRLRPSSKDTNTGYFGEGSIADGTDSGNGIDYFAIRYN